MQEISASAAAELLQDNPDTTVLLDVREPAELETAAVSSAVHIPMGDIPTRLEELDRGKTIVCMCHLGGRSAQVAAYLESQGFPEVINMAGGIEAWAATVDSGVGKAD